MNDSKNHSESFSKGEIENIDLTLRSFFATDKKPHLMLDDNREYNNRTGIVQHPDFVIYKGRSLFISDIMAGIPDVPKVLDSSGLDHELMKFSEKTMIDIFGDEGMSHIDPYYGYYAGLTCDCCGNILNYLTRSLKSYGLCESCHETTSPTTEFELE